MNEVIPVNSNVSGLLLSVRSIDEAEQVLKAVSSCLSKPGQFWLDLKEPSSGSLGRPTAGLLNEFLALKGLQGVCCSVAGGELSDWTIDLNVHFAAMLPTECCIKFGLANCNGKNWPAALEQILPHLKRPAQLIPVHYADFHQANCPTWTDILDVSHQLGCRFILVDTHDKTQGGLLDHYSCDQLKQMICLAHLKDLGVALAGSLQTSQIESLMEVGASWLGARGAVCAGGTRTSSLCADRLGKILSQFSSPLPL